jgi:hypothetical protein
LVERTWNDDLRAVSYGLGIAIVVLPTAARQVPRPSVDPKDTGQQDYSRNDFRALALEVLGERPCKERLVERWLRGTLSVKTPEMVVDSAASIMAGAAYAAAFCWRARFQFQGRSSSIRLAG